MVRLLLLAQLLLAFSASSQVELRNAKIYNFSVRPTTGIDVGMVAWWKADEGSGTSLADSSGNGNTGTLTGTGASTAWRSDGVCGAGLRLTNANYVNCGNGSTINLHHAMTVSAWVYVTNLVTEQTVVFGDYDGAGSPLWNLTINQHSGNPGNIYFEYFNDGGSSIAQGSSVNLDTNGWHLICGTRESDNKIHTWLDGVLVDASPPSAREDANSTALSVCTIGRAGGFNGQYLGGSIDDVRLYNRALSATEIMALMSSCNYLAGGTPVDLLFRWTGTQGILTTNIAVASEIGADKGIIQYTESHPNLQHTVLTNEVFSRSAFNVGGVLYSTFSQSIVFDVSAADTNRSPVYEGFQWLPALTHSNMSVAIGIRYYAGGTWNIDNVNIGAGNPLGTYSVVQNIITSGAGYLNAHGDFGGTTKTPVSENLVNGRDYSIYLRNNPVAQRCEVIVVDAATGILVGAGYAASAVGAVTSMKVQDYLLAAGISSGNFRVRYVAVDWTSAAMPLEPTPIVLAATNLVAAQASVTEIDVSWGRRPYTGSTTYPYTGSVIDRYDGTNWLSVGTNLLQAFADTNGLIVGTTYTYKVTEFASGFPAISSATITSAPVTLTGSGGTTNTYYQLASGDADSDNGISASYILWCPISITNAGTCIALLFEASAYGGTPTDVRLGLYNNAGTLLESSTITVSGNGVKSAPVFQSVTAANYFVTFAAEFTDAVSIRWKNGVGVTHYNTAGSSQYANGAPSTLPTDEGPLTRSYVVGLKVSY